MHRQLNLPCRLQAYVQRASFFEYLTREFGLDAVISLEATRSIACRSGRSARVQDGRDARGPAFELSRPNPPRSLVTMADTPHDVRSYRAARSRDPLDSGTDELEGIAGTLRLTIDESGHSCELEYTLP